MKDESFSSFIILNSSFFICGNYFLNIPHPKDGLAFSSSATSSFILHPSSFFSDVVAIHDLEKICFQRDAWTYLDLIALYLTPGMVRLKATVNDRIVGFVVGDPNRWEHIGWIATVCVHPDYRQRGIGEALLAKCEEDLREKRIKLTVRVSNMSAISLYNKIGYRKTGTWERYYSGGEDAVVMEKMKE